MHSHAMSLVYVQVVALVELTAEQTLRLLTLQYFCVPGNAEHSLGTLWPVKLQCDPAEQARQSDMFAEPLRGLYVCTGQGSCNLASKRGLNGQYIPMAQATHAAESGKYPGGHTCIQELGQR